MGRFKPSQHYEETRRNTRQGGDWNNNTIDSFTALLETEKAMSVISATKDMITKNMIMMTFFFWFLNVLVNN